MKERNWKEKDFQSAFSRWLKGAHKKTGVFELKVSPDSSIPFNRLEPHQKGNLLDVKHGVFVHKLPDLGNQNPYDCFCVAGEPAFVVVMFHVKQWNQKEFFMIDVDIWDTEEKISKRKSLTEDRAREIGESFFLG